MEESKLTLAEVRRLRFPQRDRVGKVYKENKFNYYEQQQADGRVRVIHWRLKFWNGGNHYTPGWEWGFDLAPEKWDDLDWTNSECIYMWLHNYDPHRFLVAVRLTTVQDLILFLNAFKLEYYAIPLTELEPVKWITPT